MDLLSFSKRFTGPNLRWASPLLHLIMNTWEITKDGLSTSKPSSLSQFLRVYGILRSGEGVVEREEEKRERWWWVRMRVKFYLIPFKKMKGKIAS